MIRILKATYRKHFYIADKNISVLYFAAYRCIMQVYTNLFAVWC
jgi:hypothetical protein